MKDPITFDAHGKHAQSVLFSQKHELLASAGMDSKIHLWTIPGFERTRSFEGHGKSVNTLCLSPKENLLASGSSDGNVRIWSFPEGELQHTLEKQVDARFSADGGTLASIGSTGLVSLWDVNSYNGLTTLPRMDTRIFSLAYWPEGGWLVVGGTGNIYRYNLVDGEFEVPLAAHQHAVPKVIFTPGGQFLLATGAEGALTIWEVAAWTEARRIQLPAKGVLQMALSPAGDMVYVSMDNRIVGYEIPSGNQILDLPVPIKGVYGLAVSPDGSMLANAGADGKIRIWEL